MKKVLILVLDFFLFFYAFPQKKIVSAGPMLGYLTMHETVIWLQTTQEATIQVAYYKIETEHSERVDTLWSDKIITSKNKAFTAHIILNKLSPNSKYQYDIFINNKKIKFNFPTKFTTKKIWRYRTDPPNFKFAAGSGSYINDPKWDRPNKPHGGGYEIYRSIYEKHPDFMLCFIFICF